MFGLLASHPHSTGSRQDRLVQPGVGKDLGNVSSLRQPASLERSSDKSEEKF